MARFHLAAAFVALVALGTACGDDDSDDGDGTQGSGGSAGTGSGSGSGGTQSGGSGFLGSCDTRTVDGPSIGQCRDWNGDGTADLSVSCGGLDGVFSASDPCPEEARVGTCTLDPVLGISATYNYYEPEYDAAEAEDNCEALDGTFEG